MERIWPQYLQAKYLKSKRLLPFWPELIQAKAGDLLGFSARFCLLLFVYFGLDLFRTRLINCKLSHGEWKAFNLNIYKLNT